MTTNQQTTQPTTWKTLGLKAPTHRRLKLAAAMMGKPINEAVDSMLDTYMESADASPPAGQTNSANGSTVRNPSITTASLGDSAMPRANGDKDTTREGA